MSKKTEYVLIIILLLCNIALLTVWIFAKKSCIESTVNYSINVSAGQIGSSILGSPTDSSVELNILAEKGMTSFVEYGTNSGLYSSKTDTRTSTLGEPILITIAGLKANTKYYYRVSCRKLSDSSYTVNKERFFYTQRSTGSTFSFGVQGDSHPERTGTMFSSGLYSITMQNAAKLAPDMYFTLGDDFSIESLIDKKQQTQSAVDDVYLYQRKFLDVIGSYSPVFLVNGNHEQAAKYLLDGAATSFPVLAANARNNLYPLPEPGNFYGGDTQKVDNIGYIKDYYSFEWGDALFVTIDPYWHSELAVDNSANSDKKTGDLWNNTLGDIQYQWFKNTLENSNAKYKFVFSHHVLGTGRGGIENARLYEWGGYNKSGVWEFDKMRPGWELPIHQLMVKNKVTIFFQGHDHLFAKQELDGIIYQEVPNPADDTYTAFNKDAYKTGDTLPNSGFLNVTVSPDSVKVDYIKSFLPANESLTNINGGIGYSYVKELK